MSYKTVTLQIPTHVTATTQTDGSTGPAYKLEIPIGEYSDAVLQKAIVNGFLKAVYDISKGKVPGEDGKADRVCTDKEWHEKRSDRLKAWEQGEWALRGAGERGDSNMRFLKEHYMYECLTTRNMSASKVEKEIKATIEAHLPKDTKATFDNFMLALATAKGGTADEIAATHKMIETKLQERADKAAKERAKVAAKMDTSGALDLLLG